MTNSARSKSQWVRRGILSASECFNCQNKARHRLIEDRVAILCIDLCNYKPIEARQTLRKLDDIEQPLPDLPAESS